MKILLLLFIIAVNSFSQGILNFDNLNLIDPVTEMFYRAPVTLPDGKAAEGSRFTAGLFLAQTQDLQLLATTTFREGVAAGFFIRFTKFQFLEFRPVLRRPFASASGKLQPGHTTTLSCQGNFYTVLLRQPRRASWLP